MLKPKIIIPVNIKNRIQFMVDNCPLEISGLGTVVFDESQNAYVVTDVLLIDQEVGSAHTDLDDEAVAKACYDMRDSEGELAFWWHSHVNMATFWSGQDHETMDAIGKNGLCVAVVFNKKEEMRGALVMSPEGFPKIKIDDVDIEVQYEYDFDTELLLAEMKQKVRVKTYTSILSSSPASTIGSESVYATKEYRQMALDTWSKLSRVERDKFATFTDFMEDFIWGQYEDKTYSL